MYTLYDHPYSQHARRVRALLEIAELPYELAHVALDKGEHMSEDFLKLNPNHQIPVLVSDEIVISESNAIMRFLCNQHDIDEWYPKDANSRAMIDQWLDWAQCKMSPAVINIVFYTVFMTEGDNDDIIKSGHKTMKELGPILNAALQEQDFLVGDHPTIADLAIASNVTQLAFADAVPDYPNISKWMERICSIPGVQTTLPKMGE